MWENENILSLMCHIVTNHNKITINGCTTLYLDMSARVGRARSEAMRAASRRMTGSVTSTSPLSRVRLP